MTVQTDITPKDLKALGQHVASSNGGTRLIYTMIIGCSVAVGGVLGFTLAVTRIEPHFPSLTAGLFAGAFSLVLFSRLYMRKIAPAPDSYIFGPRTVSITGDGIIEKSKKHEMLFRRSAIRSVDLAREHIFVMLERNVAIIVPCRSFASEAERDQFLTEARASAPSASLR
jgi:hypothetical protein